MALGKISGHMLTSNLLRNNEDLSFETNLLYLSVSDLNPANYKIGIGTDSPAYLFDVNGTSRSTKIKSSEIDINNINIKNNTISSIGNLILYAPSNKIVFSSDLTSNYKVLVGTGANETRFPNADAVVSNTAVGLQQSELHNIGLVAEGTAHPTDPTIYGIGVYGVGYTNAGTRSGGVVGEAHVSASSDSGSAIGVRGYSNDTHASGLNIGLYGDATGGSANYALAMNRGNILSNFAQTWTLNGNLTFDGAYSISMPALTLTSPLPVSSGGTGVTSSTGTNSVVLSNSPILVTPNLGVATATSINKITITAPSNSATLTLANSSSLITTGNSLTLSTTADTNVTLPTSGTLVNSAVTTLSLLSSIGTITTGTWSGLFGAISGENLTVLTASSLTGTIPSTVLGNSSIYVGTTALALNRSSGSLSLSGVNFDTTNISASLTIPVGDSSVRPSSPTVGNIRYNTFYNYYEGHNGVNWGRLANVGVGDGLNSTSVKISDYNAQPAELVRTNSTDGSFLIYLPTSPEDGTVVGVLDIANTCSLHNISVIPPVGTTIEGDATSLILDIDGVYVTFVYVLATTNWKLQVTPVA
jgi:hypothetical protein